jgi:biotin carboxylase
MGSRRKRLSRIIFIDRFLEDAEHIHRTLIGYTSDLSVTSPQYEALQKVHAELIAAIKVVTGDDAPWIHRTSSGPVRRVDRDE